MFRLVQSGNALPFSFARDENAEFQPGMIAQLTVVGNQVVCGVCLLASCVRVSGEPIFGVRRDIWNGLSSKEKQQVIDSYHSLEQQRLDNQRQANEMHARTEPIRVVADVIGTIVKKKKKNRR